MKRFVVAVTVWAMGLAWVLGSVVLPAGSAAAEVVSTPGGFTSLAPSRLLDTRDGTGVPQGAGAVAAYGTVDLQVTGRGGVPGSGVSSVVLNVTVTEPVGEGYVTVYGDGTQRPWASNLNLVPGKTVPNLVVAPVGANGKVALYNGSPGTIHLVADVSGWYSNTTADTGAISGTVSEAGTHQGLAHVNVNVNSPSTGFGSGTQTADDGSYTVTGLPVGADYQVCFNASGATGGSADNPGYVDQCYNNQPLSGTPTPVSVTTGGTTPGINAALVAGGAIHGTVTEAGTQNGLANVWVSVNSPSTGFGSGNMTSADGSYSVVVPAGTDYQVCFNASRATGGSSDNPGYVDQCYNNKPPSGTPTPVSVTTGVTTPGINAALVAGGAIHGTVTEAGTQHGLAHVGVNVHSPSTGYNWGSMTADDGSYSVVVPAGTDYQVCFWASGATGGSSDTHGYVDQCYNNKPPSATPTPVSVTTGVTTSGINAVLVAGGAIHGTVTEAGTQHGLANVNVNVNSPSTGFGSGTQTADDGSYTVTGLPAGADYQVCFNASGATGGSSDATGYIDQCYNNKPPSGTPTPVSVTTGVTTPGINAALVAGGAIHGTVTEAGTQHGLAHVNVNVNSPSTGFGSGTQTADDGSYSVVVPAGADYQVCFNASGATGGSADNGYIDQCYNNKPPSGTPTPVSVTTGVTTPGIDAALASGGAIHGTVTEAGTQHGLANVNVNVNSPSTGYGSGTQTADDGSYTVTGLPAGTDYQVCFQASGATGGSSDATGYINQCYNNKPPSGTPTPVSVTTGVTTPGINAALVAGGAIHGTVTEAGTQYGLANVNVSVSSPSIGGDYATTAADGSYTVTGLPAGTDYTVCFDASGATGGSSDTHGYVNQCYNNKPPSGTPTPVSVTTGVTTGGIGAALVAGGAIHGTVTDAGTHQGLGNIWAYVSSPSTGAFGVAATGADGSYTVTGLPAGTDYQVCFEGYGPMGGGSGPPWFVGQCYNNQPQGTPTQVGVTVGVTTPGIDAALVAGGSIHGTVTDARGPLQGPGEGVNVSVHSPSTGYSWSTGVPLGFDFGVNVPAGTDYQVCFSAPGFVDQCYDNQPVGTPTPVSVTTGEATDEINAALVAGPAAPGAVPNAGGTHHGLTVPERLAAAHEWSRPQAVSPHRTVIRPPTVSSAYRAGFRAEALWIRQVRIHSLSSGLIRARIGVLQRSNSARARER